MRCLSWLVLGGLLAGCSADAEVPQATEVEDLTERVRRPDPYAESTTRHGEVILHAGFSPDPLTVTGTTVGTVSAKNIHRRCSGWVGEEPDFLLRARTAFLKLHVLARSEEDLVLVVRKPDGRVVCNDNRNGQSDPMVHSNVPIGTAQVFVGTRHKGTEASFRLGFSELKWKPSELELP